MGTQGTQSVAAVEEEMRSPIDAEKTRSEKTKLRLFRLCEAMVLIPVLLIILGLFLIPTIYYTVFVLL